MSIKTRLVRLGDRLGPGSPPGCRWTDGGHCATRRLVRVGPDEPAAAAARGCAVMADATRGRRTPADTGRPEEKP